MRVVHVRVSRAAFADTMGKMRIWLDQNSQSLVRCETAPEGASIRITIELLDDALADAFCRDFGATADC